MDDCTQQNLSQNNTKQSSVKLSKTSQRSRKQNKQTKTQSKLCELPLYKEIEKSKVQCSICNLWSHSPLGLLEHLNKYHSNDANLDDVLQDFKTRLGVPCPTCALIVPETVIESHQELLHCADISVLKSCGITLDPVIQESMAIELQNHQCPFCLFSFYSWDEILIHCQKHQDEAVYSDYRDMVKSNAQMERLNNTELGLCQICGVIVKNMTSLKTHYKAEHADSAQYSHLLEECEGRITNAVERVKYTREYNVKCQLCKQGNNEGSKGFKDYDNLLLHIQAFHKQHPRFQTTWNDVKEKTKKKCEKCNKMLKNKYLLQGHILTAHPTPESKDKSKAKCQICKQIFSTKIALASHKRRVHSEGSTVCKECGKTFTCQQDLQTHFKHVHMKAKTVKCSICDKEVRIKNHTRHLRTHAAQHPYSCQYCEKTFAAKINRDRHENLIHEKQNKKTFTCAKCNKSYTSKNSLKQHLTNIHQSTLESNNKETEQEKQQTQNQENQVQEKQHQQLVVTLSSLPQAEQHEEPTDSPTKGAETEECKESESLEMLIQQASGEDTEVCVETMHVGQHRVPTIHEAAMAIKPSNLGLSYTPVPSEVLLADIAEEDITAVLDMGEDNTDSE